MSSGFEELREQDDWPDEVPDKFFVTRAGTAIIAILKTDVKSGLFLEADSQSASLKVVPGAVFRAECEQTSVHPTNPGLWWSWLDRDLAVAGDVLLADGTIRHVFIPQTVAIIPSLSSHQMPGPGNRPTFVMPDHFFPIFSIGNAATLPGLLARALGCDSSDVVKFVLSLVPAEPSALVGLEGEFIATYRSALIGPLLALEALIAAARPARGLIALAVFDGATTPAGALSHFLPSVLRRIGSPPDFALKSVLMYQENLPTTASWTTPIALGAGCFYEWSMRNTFTGDPIAVQQHLARLAPATGAGLPAARPRPGGLPSTGAWIAAGLGMPGIGVGIPVMGLRSIREVVSCDDVKKLDDTIRAFFALAQ